MLVKTLLGSLAAKVAVGLGLATAGVTAASAAGVLPAAAQHAVATVVGAATPFQLSDPTVAPAGGERRDSDAPGSTTTSSSTTSTSIRGTTTTSMSPTTTVAGKTDDGRKDNHGACVSPVAGDKSQAGEDHGKTVSSVARSDCGKDSTSAPSTTVKASTTTTTAVRTSGDKGKGGTDESGSGTGKGGKDR